MERRDVSFAYIVFRRFLQRVDERVAMIDQILKQPLDFTTDEQMVVDRDLAQYPRTPAEAADRWRQRIKYDLLVLEADKKEGGESGRSRPQARASGPKRRNTSTAIAGMKSDRSKEKAPIGQEARDKLARRYHSFAKRMHQTTQRRTAGDVFELVHHGLRSAHRLHVARHAEELRHRHEPGA